MARPNLSINDIKRKISENIIVDPVKGCFLWQRSVDITGYGRQSWNGRTWKVHRLMWTLIHGEISEGVKIRHKCDVWSCCNPTHLIIGSAQDNSNDMVERGRVNAPREECHGNVKVKWFEVLEIRRRYAQGDCTHQDLADEFGFKHEDSVGQIIRGERWAWLHPDYHII